MGNENKNKKKADTHTLTLTQTHTNNAKKTGQNVKRSTRDTLRTLSKLRWTASAERTPMSMRRRSGSLG